MLVGTMTLRKQWRVSAKVLLCQLAVCWSWRWPACAPGPARRAVLRAARRGTVMSWIAPVGPGVNSADRSVGLNRRRRPPGGASPPAPVAGSCWLQRPAFRL